MTTENPTPDTSEDAPGRPSFLDEILSASNSSATPVPVPPAIVPPSIITTGVAPIQSPSTPLTSQATVDQTQPQSVHIAQVPVTNTSPTAVVVPQRLSLDTTFLDLVPVDQVVPTAVSSTQPAPVSMVDQIASSAAQNPGIPPTPPVLPKKK